MFTLTTFSSAFHSGMPSLSMECQNSLLKSIPPLPGSTRLDFAVERLSYMHWPRTLLDWMSTIHNRRSTCLQSSVQKYWEYKTCLVGIPLKRTFFLQAYPSTGCRQLQSTKSSPQRKLQNIHAAHLVRTVIQKHLKMIKSLST